MSNCPVLLALQGLCWDIAVCILAIHPWEVANEHEQVAKINSNIYSQGEGSDSSRCL